MRNKYKPELGQVVWGQPHKEYAVPQIWDAALEAVRDVLDTVMWNIHQRSYENPFGNTGASFKCDVFEVQAYSWSDEEQPFNFKWRDVEISWYKYLGRGMSANKELSADLAAQMLKECVDAVWALDSAKAGG